MKKIWLRIKTFLLGPYNYSYVRDRLLQGYGMEVSLSTVIDRAKKGRFYIKKSKSKAHDREVITNYIGELIQHDSSHHKWSPCAEDKWYLITSIDDYSRFMLYARLFLRETSWAHIQALEEVGLSYGRWLTAIMWTVILLSGLCKVETACGEDITF